MGNLGAAPTPGTAGTANPLFVQQGAPNPMGGNPMNPNPMGGNPMNPAQQPGQQQTSLFPQNTAPAGSSLFAPQSGAPGAFGNTGAP